MAQNPFGALSNNDFISQLLGTAPDYSEAIGADQQKRLVDNAQQQAMLNGVIALLGLSGPQRQQVGTGQALGAALGAGIGGYNESMDRTLKQALTGMQLQEYTAKRARQAAMQRGLEGAITNTPQPIPMARTPGSQLEMLSRPEFGGGMADAETIGALTGNLPTKQTIDLDKLLAVIAKNDPLEAAKLMVKEGKESFQPMTNDQKKQYGLPVNKPYQISSSGKILDIGTGPQSIVQVMPQPEKNVLEIDSEIVKGYVGQAAASRQFSNTSTQINELLKGKGGGQAVKVGADIAKAFNLPNDTVAANDLAKSLNIQTAVKVRPAGSGSQSNIEFNAYIDSVPSLSNSESGRNLMTKAANKFATRNELYADHARNLYKSGKFSLTAMQDYDNSLGPVLGKDFFDEVNKYKANPQTAQPIRRSY